jgi:hypothetical protein
MQSEVVRISRVFRRYEDAILVLALEEVTAKIEVGAQVAAFGGNKDVAVVVWRENLLVNAEDIVCMTTWVASLGFEHGKVNATSRVSA